MSSPVRFSLTIDQVDALETVEDGQIEAGERCMAALQRKGIVRDDEGTLTPFGKRCVALVAALPARRRAK